MKVTEAEAEELNENHQLICEVEERRRVDVYRVYNTVSNSQESK